MNILVTGAEGFLGINLCIALRRLGHTVISVDNHSTSDEIAWKLACEDEPLLHGVERIFGDMGAWDDPPLLHTALPIKNHPPDLIYHLACPASPKRYQRMPLETLGTSILGAQRLLDGFACPVVLASTSEIYGEPLDHPQSEWLNAHIAPRGPRACYESGKLAMEAVAECYPTAWTVRIFNTYGPYMHPDDGRVVSAFVCAALRGQPMPVQGGSQTRSFCYVDDLVEGLLEYGQRVDDARYKRREPPPRVINLGHPDAELTMTELAVKIWGMVTGETIVPVTALDLPQNDPTRRRPDITLAKAALGWEPVIDLNTGLKMTVDYFKRRLGV